MGMIGAAFGLGFMIGPFLGGCYRPSRVFGGPFATDWWAAHPYFLLVYSQEPSPSSH
jgi:hypothetical protein